MQHDILRLPGRGRLAALCLLYAVMMCYSATIIGPSGVNFVYRDPTEAFRFFLHTPYVHHGSDQRADWIGNLLMLVPFGFLVTGAIWPRPAAFKLPAILGATLICIGVILAIKYLQLFFPPRTVSLNYILAQSVGAIIGCVGWTVWQGRIMPAVRQRDPVGVFVLALWLYAGALFLFVLMPLDFALNAADLRAQLDRLPNTVLMLPGGDRPLVVRVILLVVAAGAFIPVGMLLTFIRKGVYQVRRSLPAVAMLGALSTLALYGLAALVISAYPVMPSILYRTVGIMAGAVAIRWLVRQDLDALRSRLRRSMPTVVLPYLLCVLMVNRLLSFHWLSLPQAAAQAYPLGFMPLFDYYIVTKAEAAKNIIGHFALYLPVGVLLWLRYDNPNPRMVFAVAAGLSFTVELGRYLRPELQGDINAVVVAGLAAVVGARFMPVAWSMLRVLRRRSALAPRRQCDPADQLLANRSCPG